MLRQLGVCEVRICRSRGGFEARTDLNVGTTIYFMCLSAFSDSIAYMAVMDNRSEAGDRHGSSSNTNHHLGVSRNSSKISKAAVGKRNPIQPPKQQPPVYNIDKNDFRNTVQRLTGSPASSGQASPPAAAANKQPQCNARLQKIRPPPLAFAAHGPLNPAPIQASLPGPTANALAVAGNPFAPPSPTFFSPLPPLTPGDEVWANASESPIHAAISLRDLPNGTNNNLIMQQQEFAGAAPIAMNAWASQWNPSPHKPLPRPNPNSPGQFPGSQFALLSPLPSPASQFPLPSPGGSQFQSPGFQFPPSPGALFSVSPLSSLAGYQSPGAALFPPSPAARFGVASPRGGGGLAATNNVKWLADSPTAGLAASSHFSFPDHARHI